MNQDQLKECLVVSETPFYLYDFDRLRRDIAGIRSAMEGKADLCFSVKSNPFLVKAAQELVDRVEICSSGEYQICRKCGIEELPDADIPELPSLKQLLSPEDERE